MKYKLQKTDRYQWWDVVILRYLFSKMGSISFWKLLTHFSSLTILRLRLGLGQGRRIALWDYGFWETNFDPVSYASTQEPIKRHDSVSKTVPYCTSIQLRPSLQSSVGTMPNMSKTIHCLRKIGVGENKSGRHKDVPLYSLQAVQL